MGFGLTAAAKVRGTETDARATRLFGSTVLAERLGRHVAIARNTDIEAVLFQRQALLDAATAARATLVCAQQDGDAGMGRLIESLDAAIAGRP